MNDPVLSKIKEDLDRFNKVEYKWHQVRLKELIKFRDTAQSNMAKDLMVGACTLTMLSYQIWELIAKECTAFMLAVAAKYEQSSGRKKEHLENDVIKINESFTELTESLIYKTYKPDYRHFHKETAKELIVSALKKIDMLSILDDIESLRKIDPKYRMSKQLKSGDEVISYVENYNELVVEWACAAKSLEVMAKQLTSQLTKVSS